MPVDIHRAHAVHPVGGGNGNVIDYHATNVSLGDIASGLRTHVGHGIDNAIRVGEVGLLSGTDVFSGGKQRSGVNCCFIVGLDDGLDDGGVVGGTTIVDNDRGGRGVRTVRLKGNDGSKFTNNDEGNHSDDNRHEGGLARARIRGVVSALFCRNERV